MLYTAQLAEKDYWKFFIEKNEKVKSILDSIQTNAKKNVDTITISETLTKKEKACFKYLNYDIEEQNGKVIITIVSFDSKDDYIDDEFDEEDEDDPW